MRKNTQIILWIVIAVLLVALVGIVVSALVIFNSNEFYLVLDLKGQEEITLEYGSAYEDAGAEAWVYGSVFMKEGQSLQVTVDNPVDTSKIGTYTVKYSVSYTEKNANLSASIQRTIHIVDTQAPVIELVADPDAYTFPGFPYEEEGFTAFDDYDGDITDRVERTEENGVVTYRVKDSSGNETVVTRTIVYADPVAPVLTLRGDNPMVLTVGTAYEEPGFTAMDSCDGDLTANVVISGDLEINKYVAGTYTITYTVTDSAGNTTTVDRTVEVQPAQNPGTVTPNGKVIYLTFDDGPGPYTGKLLDVLAKYNVKATFFVVHTGYYDTLRRIVNEGHAIGVHATDHDYSKIYASEEAYFNDMENMKRIILEQTGYETQLIRFPGGSSNTVSRFNKGIMTRLTKAVRAMGYQYFDWNVDSNDAGGATTSEKVAQNVINGCKNNKVSVVLQHDIKNFSVNAVEQIIIWGLENGYTFLPLDVTSPGMHHGLNN